MITLYNTLKSTWISYTFSLFCNHLVSEADNFILIALIYLLPCPQANWDKIRTKFTSFMNLPLALGRDSSSLLHSAWAAVAPSLGTRITWSLTHLSVCLELRPGISRLRVGTTGALPCVYLMWSVTDCSRRYGASKRGCLYKRRSVNGKCFFWNAPP